MLELTWDYPTEGAYDDPDAEAVLREISGFDLKTGKEIPRLPAAQGRRLDARAAAGSTPAATPTGSTRSRGASRARSSRWVAPEWGWAWPMNRRILYNRASADPEGKPWSERKRYLWWDADAGKWTGRGRARLHGRHGARLPAARGRRRARRAPRRRAVHHAGRRQGVALRAGGSGRRARCPPTTSRTSRPSATRSTPASSPTRPASSSAARRTPTTPPTASRASTSFPTWSRPTASPSTTPPGGMSRWLPYLAELQPEMFCEVSPALARERGLVHGGWMTVVTAARRHRGPRDGHRADDPADASDRAGCPPGRPALPLGLARAS